jgi:hypothetical protein
MVAMWRRAVIVLVAALVALAPRTARAAGAARVVDRLVEIDTAHRAGFVRYHVRQALALEGSPPARVRLELGTVEPSYVRMTDDDGDELASGVDRSKGKSFGMHAATPLRGADGLHTVHFHFEMPIHATGPLQNDMVRYRWSGPEMLVSWAHEAPGGIDRMRVVMTLPTEREPHGFACGERDGRWVCTRTSAGALPVVLPLEGGVSGFGFVFAVVAGLFVVLARFADGQRRFLLLEQQMAAAQALPTPEAAQPGYRAPPPKDGVDLPQLLSRDERRRFWLRVATGFGATGAGLAIVAWGASGRAEEPLHVVMASAALAAGLLSGAYLARKPPDGPLLPGLLMLLSLRTAFVDANPLWTLAAAGVVTLAREAILRARAARAEVAEPSTPSS